MLTVDGEPVEDISTATTTNTFPIYKSAAVAKIQGVYLKKTDSTAPTLLLPDAVFDLQRWDGTQYVHDRTITTSSTAASVVDKLECGTAYRLTETQAPVDYNLDSTPYEFALKACEAPTGLKPDGWHGVEHITMDTITRTNQRIPVKHTMPTTGQGLILILLLGISPDHHDRRDHHPGAHQPPVNQTRQHTNRPTLGDNECRTWDGWCDNGP